MAKTGAKKAKQADLPEMPLDARRIEEIEVAAGSYDDLNKEFAEVSKRKKAAKKELRETMRRNKKEHYKCGEWEVWCEPQEDAVKVKRGAAPDSD